MSFWRTLLHYSDNTSQPNLYEANIFSLICREKMRLKNRTINILPKYEFLLSKIYFKRRAFLKLVFWLVDFFLNISCSSFFWVFENRKCISVFLFFISTLLPSIICRYVRYDMWLSIDIQFVKVLWRYNNFVCICV